MFKKNQLNDVSVRSDPHILVVGDPGLGKSQLLQACSKVSNRGVYVCGNSSTSAGLTVNWAYYKASVMKFYNWIKLRCH